MRGWMAWGLVALLAACGGPPPGPFVVIDRRDPSFTVFTPSPPDRSEMLKPSLYILPGPGTQRRPLRVRLHLNLNFIFHLSPGGHDSSPSQFNQTAGRVRSRCFR